MEYIKKSYNKRYLNICNNKQTDRICAKGNAF